MSAKWYPVFLEPEAFPLGPGHENKTGAEAELYRKFQMLEEIQHGAFTLGDFDTYLLTDEQVKEMRDDN